MYNSQYFQNVNESNITGDNNSVNQDMDVNVNMNMNMSQMGTCPNRIRERVIHRTFVHEVPQDCSFMIEK